MNKVLAILFSVLGLGFIVWLILSIKMVAWGITQGFAILVSVVLASIIVLILRGIRKT